MASIESFELGDVLPDPVVKGDQPRYLETLASDGVPVLSTICILPLDLDPSQARFISREDFDGIDPTKVPQRGDVLLTVDGGPSIGKAAAYDLEEEFAIDSHVAILRPVGIDAKFLAHLLASPLGQVQFNRAECGASGQTAVTEEELRRFRFPVLPKDAIARVVNAFDNTRREVADQRAALAIRYREAWDSFNESIIGMAKSRK